MLPLRDVKIKTLRGAVNSCAWTGLFEHFRKLMFEIGPESAVNLSRPVMDSYRLHCIPTFVPMMPTPPPAFK